MVKGRFDKFTDEQMLAWLNKNIALRKELVAECEDGGLASSGIGTDNLLLYSAPDVIRFSSILGLPFEVNGVKGGGVHSLDYKVFVELNGILIYTYCTKEDLDECGISY